MNDSTQKIRENRARRQAKRQGKIAVKSRTHDTLADTFGHWVLVDDSTGNRHSRLGGQAALRALQDGQGVSLSALEAILNWDDIFVADIEDSEDMGRSATRVTVLSCGGTNCAGGKSAADNDGSPVKWWMGGTREDAGEARERAVAYLQGWRDDLG